MTPRAKETSTVTLTIENETIFTVEDVEGLVALPIGARFEDVDGDTWTKKDVDTYVMTGASPEGVEADFVIDWLPGVILNVGLLLQEDHEAKLAAEAFGGFEVGDRVRVADTGSTAHAGRTGTITLRDASWAFPLQVNFDDDDHGWYNSTLPFQARELEPLVESLEIAELPELAVGAWVAITAPGTWGDERYGKVTRIESIFSPYPPEYPVRVDVVGEAERGYFPAKASELTVLAAWEVELLELEPVVASLKPELADDRVSGGEELDALANGTVVVLELSKGSVVSPDGVTSFPKPDYAVVKIESDWYRVDDLGHERGTWNYAARTAASNGNVRVVFSPVNN